MRHEEQAFVDEEIQLGGHEYVRCRFDGCRLVYDGSPGVEIRDCDFDGTRLELTDRAGNTLSFLQNIYHGFGDDGRKVVENLFEQIREGQIGDRGYDQARSDGA